MAMTRVFAWMVSLVFVGSPSSPQVQFVSLPEGVSADRLPDGASPIRSVSEASSELTLTTSLRISKELATWIAASFDKKHTRKNGSIVAADFNYKAQKHVHFEDALITEVGFPKLDANGKNAAYLTVHLEPRTLKSVPGDGKTIDGLAPRRRSAAAAKQWTPANFELTIDGFDEGVLAVDPLVWRLERVGRGKRRAVVSDLVVHGDAAAGRAWQTKLQSDDRRTAGELVLEAPQQTCTVSLVGLELTHVTQQRRSRFTARLSVSELDFACTHRETRP